jgi:hypothetical protein
MKHTTQKKVGLVLVVASVLVAVALQFIGRGLFRIDHHPITPPDRAARGEVAGRAVHISFAVIPLAVGFAAGLGCLLFRKRDETPVA